MSAMERIKEIPGAIGSSPSCIQCGSLKSDLAFLLKAFRVMRECFIKSLEDEHGGDCSKWADEKFEERMKE